MSDTDPEGLQQVPDAIPTGRDGMTMGKPDGHVVFLPVRPEASPSSRRLPRLRAGE